jgi:hypothetical protein
MAISIMVILAALRGILLAAWLVLRPTLGWLLIVLGLIGMPLPIINGTIFLVLGLILVGPRNKVVRWSRVHTKLFLDRWAMQGHPLLAFSGRLARDSARQVSRQNRRLRWWWMDRQKRKAAGLQQNSEFRIQNSEEHSATRRS